MRLVKDWLMFKFRIYMILGWTWKWFSLYENLPSIFMTNNVENVKLIGYNIINYCVGILMWKLLIYVETIIIRK